MNAFEVAPLFHAADERDRRRADLGLAASFYAEPG